MRTNRTALSVFLYTAGLFFCIIPPLLAVLSYFPVWRERGAAAVISGFSLILIALCFIPFFKTVKRIFSSMAAYTVWLVIFIAFLILSKIADEMVVISFFGFTGNLLGALFFKLTDRLEGKRNEKQL